MDRFSWLINSIILVISFGLVVNCARAQNVIIVGDGLGWDIPPNTSVSYSNWASGRTFRVGDTLVFNFMTNQHDVLRVPRASYDACSQENAIGNPILTGPTNITLDSAGDHYYICTFGRHCQAGQRLAITVSSGTPGAANPPMTTPTTPSPDATQPGACAPTTPGIPTAGGPAAAMTPPFGPNSAATTLTAGGLLVVLYAGIAFIF